MGDATKEYAQSLADELEIVRALSSCGRFGIVWRGALMRPRRLGESVSRASGRRWTWPPCATSIATTSSSWNPRTR